MRNLTKGEDAYMVNHVSRGLETLGIPVTPENVERELRRLDGVRGAASTGVPAARSLTDVIPAAPPPAPSGAFQDWLNQPRPVSTTVVEPRAAAVGVTTVPSPPKTALLDTLKERSNR